jgi:hypothetical protein
LDDAERGASNGERIMEHASVWFLTAVVAALSVGTLDCRARQASSGIDALAHTYWSKYDTLTDEEVLAGVRDLDAQVTTLERQKKMPLKVKVTALEAQEIAGLALPPGKDPARGQGMLVITVIPCTLLDVEKIVTGTDFQRNFPDIYNSYVRSYASSLDDYYARRASKVAWSTTYESTLLGDSFRATVPGEARWIPQAASAGASSGATAVAPRGPALIDRALLPEPATFLSATSKSFTQDYQVDVYYERAAGQVVHLFADWREMNAGTFSTNDEAFITISLSNFVDFDTRLAKLCRK